MTGKGNCPREPKRVMSYMVKQGNRVLKEEKETVALHRREL